MKALCKELQKSYDFVSILGSDVRTKAIRVNKNTSTIGPGRDSERGFVIKLYRGKAFLEYSLDDLSGDVSLLAQTVCNAFKLCAMENKIGSV